MTAKEFQAKHGKKKTLRKKTNAQINKEMTESFLRQCKEIGLPIPECEYKFHPTRKWKIDFAIYVPYKMYWLAVEIEGYGHNRIGNFTRDMEKYNELAFAGISLLRFTVKEVMSGKAIEQLKRIL